MARRKGIGNRIAPARFLLFFAMLVVAVAGATVVTPWWLSVMVGFDVAALVFVASLRQPVPARREGHAPRGGKQ